MFGKDIQVNILMIHKNCHESAHVQTDSSGELIDAADSSHFLLDETLAGHGTNMPSSDIYLQIHTPLNTTVTFPATNYHALLLYLGSQAVSIQRHQHLIP